MWCVLVSLQEKWTLHSWFIKVHIFLFTCVLSYLIFSGLRKSHIIICLLINFLKAKCFSYKYLISSLRIHWFLNIQRWGQRDGLVNQNACCSCRVLESSSKHYAGYLTTAFSSRLEDPLLPSDLVRQQQSCPFACTHTNRNRKNKLYSV